jgi:DNA-binding MarR family transcriptional regulator
LPNFRNFCNIRDVSTESEVQFADHVGQYFANLYSFPPLTGRVLGWLLICEPPEQTAAELAEALHASRSAVGGAINMLDTLRFVRRSRAAGERVDRVSLHPDAWERSFETPGEHDGLQDLADQGLAALGDDTPPSRRARLLEVLALNEFLRDRTPKLQAEWRAYRDALRASGELPEP